MSITEPTGLGHFGRINRNAPVAVQSPPNRQSIANDEEARGPQINLETLKNK